MKAMPHGEREGERYMRLVPWRCAASCRINVDISLLEVASVTNGHFVIVDEEGARGNIG